MYSEFSNNVKPMVSTLVSDFDRKKVAYELKKTRRKASGNLDMGRLAFYKTTDQVFKKRSVKPEGKSHGLYVLVDWSGSMSGRTISATRQTITLAKFAKKAGIDFSAYIFVSDGAGCRNETPGRISRGAKLIEVLSSNTSNSKFEESCKVFYNMGVLASNRDLYTVADMLGCSHDEARAAIDSFHWGGLSLTNTPLSESMVNAYDVLSTRVKNKRIQNPNLILISDGSCTGTSYCKYDGHETYRNMSYTTQPLVDPSNSTHMTTSDRVGSYSARYRMVGAMMHKFRSSGFKTTTFYITSKNNLNRVANFHSIYDYGSPACEASISAELKSNNKSSVNGLAYLKDFAGCDNYYYISDRMMADTLDIIDEEDTRDYSKASAAQLSRSLIKQAAGLKSKRFLASLLAEQIAEVYAS